MSSLFCGVSFSQSANGRSCSTKLAISSAVIGSFSNRRLSPRIQLIACRILCGALLAASCFCFIATNAFAQSVQISLEPIADIGALIPDQVFDVNIRLHAHAGDVMSITQFQFDLGQITGATILGISWNQDYLGDTSVLNCGFDGPGGMPECGYSSFSFEAIHAVTYLYESYDPISPFDAERPPVHLFTTEEQGLIIGTLHLQFNANEQIGSVNVCGFPNEYAQTGVALVSMNSEYFDLNSNQTVYSEYQGNISGCADSTLSLVPAAEEDPVIIELPLIDEHNESYAQFAYPPNGAIDTRKPGMPYAGFDRFCLRFAIPVSAGNLIPGQFTVSQYLANSFPTSPGYAIDPNQFQVPAISSILYNSQAIEADQVPGNDGTNVACLVMDQKMNPGTWLVFRMFGGVSRAWFGYLPCDVNQTGTCSAQDQEYFNIVGNPKQYENQPSFPLYLWQWDINGNGSYNYWQDKGALMNLRFTPVWAPYPPEPMWEGISLPDINMIINP